MSNSESIVEHLKELNLKLQEDIIRARVQLALRDERRTNNEQNFHSMLAARDEEIQKLQMELQDARDVRYMLALAEKEENNELQVQIKTISRHLEETEDELMQTRQNLNRESQNLAIAKAEYYKVKKELDQMKKRAKGAFSHY